VGGIGRMRAGEQDDALRWLETARFLCPACVGTQLYLADTALAHGDVDQAGLFYWEALMLRPERQDEILGHLMSKKLPLNDLARILAGYRKAADAVPGYLWNEGRSEDVVPWLKALLAIEGPDLSRMAALGSNYIWNHPDLDQAGYVAAELVVLFPDAPEGYKLQGDIQASQGDDLGNLAMLREARLRAPQNIPLALDELTCLNRLKRTEEFDRLADNIRPLVEEDPSLAFRFHLQSAYRLEQVDKLTDALSEVSLAARAAPRDLGVFFVRARIYTKLRDFVRAAEEYRQILRYDPNNSAAKEAVRQFEAEKDNRLQRLVGPGAKDLQPRP